MAEKKMTRKKALENVLGWIADGYIPSDEATVEEVQGILEKMAASIEKQSKRPRGVSRTRIENEKLADNLVGEMVAYGKPVNTKWITEHVRYILNSQKATAVCKVAMDKGDIIRTVDEKKKVWYSLAE